MFAARQTAAEPQLLSRPDYNVTCVRFIETDAQLLSSSTDCSCVLWDTNKLQPASEFKGHRGEVTCVSVNEDPSAANLSCFLTSSLDSSILLWDRRICSAPIAAFSPGCALRDVQFFPDGFCFLSGGDDGVTRLFDLRSHRQLNFYCIEVSSNNNTVHSPIHSIAVSRSGRFVFVVAEMPQCYMFNSISGRLVHTLKGHEDRVTCVAVAHDGYAVATGSADQTVRIWA